MRKLLVLAVKEVLLAFRDFGSVIAMLLTPLALTLAIAAAFGTGGTTTLSDIPVKLLNLDDGVFSQDVIDVFQSDAVQNLITLEFVSDEMLARQQVEADQAAALVIIPEDFSERILPLNTLTTSELGLDLFTMTQEDYETLSPEELRSIGAFFMQVQEAETDPAVIEIYASPNWQISTAVVRGITTQALEQINMTLAGTNAIISRLVEAQIEQGGEFTDLFDGMGQMKPPENQELPIKLTIISPTGRGFNWLDYSATSMAVLFLMFAVTSSGRTLLAERQMGTLSRLLISPTKNLTILLGKMAGIVLTGLLQVLVLWGATSLIGAYWGAPLNVIAAIFLLVLSATGVGALISAWAKTPAQVSAMGTAFTLIGGALSGSFFPRANLPAIVQQISLITPNAWGIEIFARLQSGHSLQSVLPWFGGLLLLTAFYYVIASFGFRRQLN